MDLAAAHSYAGADVHGAIAKKLYTSVAIDTSPCLGPYPTVACPEFHAGFRLGRELFTLSICICFDGVVFAAQCTATLEDLLCY